MTAKKDQTNTQTTETTQGTGPTTAQQLQQQQQPQPADPKASATPRVLKYSEDKEPIRYIRDKGE
jgi:hypothetical protein